MVKKPAASKPETGANPAAADAPGGDAGRSVPEQSKDSVASVAAAASSTAGNPGTPPPDQANPATRPRRAAGTSGGSTVLGVIMTLMILGAAGLGGWATRDHWWQYAEAYLPVPGSADIDALTVRVDAIESRMTDRLSVADDAAFAALQAKKEQLSVKLASVITRLEAVEASLDTVERMANAVTVVGNGTKTQGAVDALTRRLEALEAGGDGQATDLTGILARLQGVEDQTNAMERRFSGDRSTLQSVQSRIARIEQSERGASGDNGVAAFVLAVGQLRDAVRSGRAFTDSMDIVATTPAAHADAHADTHAHVSVLQSHADTGVKTLPDLQDGFEALSDHLYDAMAESGEQNWMTQTLRQLKDVVRVRTAQGFAEPGSPDYVVHRVRSKLSAGDVEGAIAILSELAVLSEPDGKLAGASAAWMSDARSHVDAERALEALHNLAIRQMIGVGG